MRIFSINSTTARNITIQNSIIGQGLQNHSCGGLMQTDLENGITLFRNLYIDNKTRNPKVKGLNQFVNNVVYNWGSGAAYNMSGDSEGSSLTSIENNYFIKGPVVNWQNVRQEDGSIKVELVDMSPTKPFIGGNERFNTYCVGNFYDEDKNGVLNGVEILPAINWEELCSGNPTFLATCPEIFPTISQQSDAEKAYEWIVKYVGASLPVRDQVDAYLISELTSLGEKGTIIQNEQDTQQFPLGGVGEIESGVSLLDTDGDGMPDEFEDGYGLDKNNPDDASQMAENGYTNIENYIFTLDERLDKSNFFFMIKLLMKYLLFAGVMAVVVGCTEEKMEEVFIEQPNSFHIKVEGDEAFALNIPSGGKIGINGKEVQVLSKGLVSLYEVPAEEKIYGILSFKRTAARGANEV